MNNNLILDEPQPSHQIFSIETSPSTIKDPSILTKIGLFFESRSFQQLSENSEIAFNPILEGFGVFFQFLSIFLMIFIYLIWGILGLRWEIWGFFQISGILMIIGYLFINGTKGICNLGGSFGISLGFIALSFWFFLNIAKSYGFSLVFSFGEILTFLWVRKQNRENKGIDSLKRFLDSIKNLRKNKIKEMKFMPV